MPTPPGRSLSDTGRQPSGGSKPKRKVQQTSSAAKSNGTLQPPSNGGAFSDSATFSDSTVPARPSPAAQKKAKAKAKAVVKQTKKPRKKHTTSLFDRFVQLILIGFILFTVNQCHNDTELKSPVCRAVNQRILEPLVIKPFNAFITHPSVAPAIESVKPVYSHAVTASQPLMRQAHRVYVMRVAPHVARLEKKTRPYVRNLQLHYVRSVAPHVHTAQVYYGHLQRTIEPYMNQALAALIHLWFELQPKLIPIIEESKFIPEWVRIHALIPLLQLREQYVDTHVYKMLEKVEEFGETKTLKAQNHITSAAVATATATSDPLSGTDATHSITSTPAIPETIEIEPTAIAITPEAITPDGPVIPDAPTSTPTVTPTSTPAASPDEEDLEAWLESLRSDATPQPESEQPVAETEEEIAERQRLKAIQTAEKRADIQRRHTEFEQKVHALGKEAVDDLETFLSAVRSVAGADLRRRAQDHIKTLQSEADKGLKGTDAYLNKLQGAAQGGAIKVAQFDDVVVKVEKKFLETAQNVSDTIASWWGEMRAEEQKEANVAAETIKTLALEGQANVGMDYAWLDDVTVADWSRYHALVDTADAYGKELQALVDGNHPRSAPNPLEEGLGGLQSMLNHIVDEFQSNLKIRHDNGLRSFGIVNPETPTEAEKEPSFSILPVAAAREDPSMLQRGKEEVEAAIKRAEAEMGSAAENVQAIFEDGFKQAGNAAHQATRTAIKAAGGTPTPETYQETAEYIAAKASEAAADASAAARARYDDASQAVHDATRSVVRAAGYTPEPETPKEHAESIIAEASSTIASVATAASSVLEDTASSAASVYSGASASAASVYSDAAASAHEATRSLSRAAGYTPTPESPKEHLQSLAAAAAEAAHQASRSMSRAAGYTPTPETPSETVEYVSAVVSEHVEIIASAVASSAAAAASTASSIYDEATRTVIKAAGGTPSPTNARETAESLAAGAQAYYAGAAASAQAYYAEAAANLLSYDTLKARAGSLVDRGKSLLGAEPAPAGYEKLLNDAFALIDEYQSELAARAHSATRAASRAAGATPTPETFGEHVESVASGVSGAISSATEAVRSVIHEDL